jgi:hypothetical protein
LPKRFMVHPLTYFIKVIRPRHVYIILSIISIATWIKLLPV